MTERVYQLYATSICNIPSLSKTVGTLARQRFYGPTGADHDVRSPATAHVPCAVRCVSGAHFIGHAFLHKSHQTSRARHRTLGVNSLPNAGMPCVPHAK